MASNITVEFTGHPEYETKMNSIKKSLSQYPGHKAIASSLGKLLPQEIVAGLIGCIVPESGSDHTIINKKEFEGRGVSGTQGWNCGEGLIQWTYWKYKLPLIKQFNSDSRATQKLPTSWDTYKRGTPRAKGANMYASQDGVHIAGLSLDNQMLFLTKYYDSIIKSLRGETNLAVIVAKIYQFKAGNGYYTSLKSKPIERAYTTAENKYYSSAGNHYLQSVKIAKEYLGVPVTPGTVEPVAGDTTYYDPSAILTSAQSPEPKVVVPETISSMNGGKKKGKRKGIVLGTNLKQK